MKIDCTLNRRAAAIRKVLASCLAVLVLSACGAAPVTQQPADDTVPLHAMADYQSGLVGSNPDFMYRTLVYEDGTSVATRVPYADGVQQVLCDAENCTHRTEACPAYLFRHEDSLSFGNVIYAADDTRLVRMISLQTYADGQIQTGPLQMTVSDLDGRNARTMPLIDMPEYGNVIYADADFMYWLNVEYKSDALGTFTLISTSFADGAQRVLCTLESDHSFVTLDSAENDALLLQEYEYLTPPEQPTVSMEESPEVWEAYNKTYQDASLDAPIRILRFRLKDKVLEETPAFTFTTRQYGTHVLRGGTFYGIRSDDNALVSHSIATGEERVLSQEIPKGDVVTISGPYAGHLAVFVYYYTSDDTDATKIRLPGKAVSVNLETGETKELTLRIAIDGTDDPVAISAAGATHMMVQSEYEKRVETGLDENGAEFNYDVWIPLYDCISIEDYLSSTPNYTRPTWLGPEYYDPTAWNTESTASTQQ